MYKFFFVLSLQESKIVCCFSAALFLFPQVEDAWTGGRCQSRWRRPTPPLHLRAHSTPSCVGVGQPVPSPLPMRTLHLGRRKWRPQLKPSYTLNLTYHDGDDCHHKCDQGKIGCHLFLLKVSFISRFFTYFRKQFLICLNKCNDCSFALFESLFTFLPRSFLF